MMLADAVSVARRFQRSIRIDTDLASSSALDGFVCNASGRAALETVARAMLETGQRAFTWTGPYGGGKSSLALALAAFAGPDPKGRQAATKVLKDVSGLRKAFPPGKDGWLVLPVMGHRGDPVSDIEDALTTRQRAARLRPRGRKPSREQAGRALIARLQTEAEARPQSGVLVLIDEMGKFLEGAAEEGADVHFFQELAEAAGRCNGRLVVIGILHQAFEQYASRLGQEARDEWAKIQGRFLDIPLVTAVDEVIDLLGRAVIADHGHPGSRRVAETVAKAIANRRPGSAPDLADRLDRCWPLHPVTAALLGPVSRRRFGQNERSTFGFLNSSEPEGFKDFLRSTPFADAATFEPFRLWDYLQINLEPAILASPDGHRWAQGAEAIDRAEARGEAIHVRLTKTVAVTDIFRNGSGLVPESAILEASLPDASPKEIERALEDLKSWSILVFRKHLGAWGVFAGSDFDIERAVAEAMAAANDLNLTRLADLAGLQTVPAKQHYYRTGTLRWFETELRSLNGIKEAVAGFRPKDGSAGKFMLVVPTAHEKNAQQTCRTASQEAGAYPIAVGLPRNAWLIRELGSELLALETVRNTRPELEGDAIARREVGARIAAVSAQLEEEIRSALAGATWHIRGESYSPKDMQGLSQLVSAVADETFSQAPLIHSELINRERPSSSTQAAVRQLLYAMLEHENERYLGIEGFPAERGLYSTVLEASGIHRQQKDESYRFCAPTARGKGSGASFKPLWEAAQALVAAAGDIVPLSKLYETWSAPPYGLRKGVLPVLATAFILTNRSSLAVYAEGAFRPELDRHVADLLLQGEELIALRPVTASTGNTYILRAMAKALETITGAEPEPEPLAVARAFVRFAFALPAWTRKTTSLTDSALAVRRVLLTASDPHRALFVDLPILFLITRLTPLGRGYGRACAVA